MMSNLELNVHRARVADMARFADQRRTMRAIRRMPPHLIRVPDGAVQSAPQPPRLEALGGASGAICPGADRPARARHGFARSARPNDGRDVLVNGRRGMLKPVATGLGGRKPRHALAGVELGNGKLTAPLRLSWTDGTTWEVDVPRGEAKRARALVEQLPASAAPTHSAES